MRKRGREFPSLWDLVCEQIIANRFPLLGELLRGSREAALSNIPVQTKSDCKGIYQGLLVIGLSLMAKERVGH